MMKFSIKKYFYLTSLIAFLALNQCLAIVENSANDSKKLKLFSKHKAVEEVLPQSTDLEANVEDEFNNKIHSVFSLQDCVNNAVKYNPEIRAAVYNELAAKTKIAQAWANYFPQISLGVGISRSGESYTKNTYLGYRSAYNTMGYLPNLSASMLIFDFGKTKATADSAKRTHEARHEITKEDINTIIADIKTTYYNILFAQAQVDVYEETVQDYELQLAQAKGFYKLGKKAKIDVTFAEYNRDKAKLNLIKAKNILKKANVQLANIMGMPEYTNFELSDEMTLLDIDCKLDNAIKTAMQVRPQLLAYEKSKEAAKMNLRATRRQYSPNIGIFGGFDYGVGNKYNVMSSQFGVSLSYDNFNILRTKEQVDEARFLYKKSIADYENVRNGIYSTVKQDYLDVQTAKDAVLTAKSAFLSGKEQARQAKGRYKAGVGDAVELKDSENTYMTSKLDFYNAMLNYNTAIAILEKDIGSPLKFSDKLILSIK